MGTGRTGRVLFVWAVRHVDHINWVAPALQQALSAPQSTTHPLSLDIRIFVTRDGRHDPRTVSVDSKDEKALAEEGAGISKLECDGPGSCEDSTPSSLYESTDTLVRVLKGRGGDLRIDYGRPDLRKIIDEELAASDGLNVSVDGESNAFCFDMALLIVNLHEVSGPTELSNSVKRILAVSPFSSPAAALRGGPNIEVHTETFGW